MTHIVLVPGAWLGGWAWDGVTEPLRTGGHDPHPVTLTGLGERTGEAGPDVNLDTHTDDLVRLILDRDLSGVLLVAHSYGGFPATAAAQRIPERIARLVFVDSGPPPDGMSQLDLQEEPDRLRERVDERGLLPPPVWDPERDPLQRGLDDAALALLRRRSTPHPFSSWSQPIRRSGELPPLALIASTFPLDQVRELIGAGHPVFAELAGAELHELPTGHWPMFSEPAGLAALLDELAVKA